MTTVINKLEVIFADTYALYLKTQNYHWHVRGPHFISLHHLFEAQYEELANAVDLIAERIVTMAHKVPATLPQIIQLKTIKDGDSSENADQMVSELAKDHGILANDLMQAIKIAAENHDEGTVSLLGERLVAHQKAHWMLNASRETRK